MRRCLDKDNLVVLVVVVMGLVIGFDGVHRRCQEGIDDDRASSCTLVGGGGWKGGKQMTGKIAGSTSHIQQGKVGILLVVVVVVWEGRPVGHQLLGDMIHVGGGGIKKGILVGLGRLMVSIMFLD